MSATLLRPVARSATRLPLRAHAARLHRWLGLAAAVFWIIQAVTGVLIVFHWEIDDATLGGRHAATDLPRIEARAAALAPAGSGRTIESIWTSAGFADRYDVTVADQANGTSRVVRVAGDGSVLRDRSDAATPFTDVLVGIHQTLLGGEAGSWIVGTTGSLLLTNLLFGLVAAWPKPRTWRRAVVPVRTGPAIAKAYSWHRAVGLWGALPAIVLVAAGTMLVFEDGTARLVGATPVAVPALPGTPRIGIAAAVASAERALPGSRLTAITTMPSETNAIYRIRLLAPGEFRRAFGTSTVDVDAVTGRVRQLHRATQAPAATRFMDMLYTVHTGEIAGTVGRLLVMSIGVWLASMIVLGLLLWQRRHNVRRRRENT
uniref:PepSY-associated TM helix domain-containing protein n=1 Tax=Sphingomonas bacterium TaxID=1895847 RepID=UPI002614F33D|nr:PepSY-associated TM helix domain-containing protein [Sphingomonas bacterium]